MENKMAHRAYIVRPELLEELKRQLDERGVSYTVVYEVVKLGNEIRPILVSNATKPKGYTRFGLCVKCKTRPLLLTDRGEVPFQAGFCEECKRSSTFEKSEEFKWLDIESAHSYKELNLPNWFNDPFIKTIADVRDGLHRNTINNVKEGRIMIVINALNKWREQYLKKKNLL